MSVPPGLLARSDRGCQGCGEKFDPRPTGRGKARSYCEDCHPRRKRTRAPGKLDPLLIPLTAAARRYLVAFEDALAHPESQLALSHRRHLLLMLRRDRTSPPSDSNR